MCIASSSWLLHKLLQEIWVQMFPELFWIFWTYTQARGHSHRHYNPNFVLLKNLFLTMLCFCFWTTVSKVGGPLYIPSFMCKSSHFFAFMPVLVSLMGVEWWLWDFSCSLLQTMQMNVLYVYASIYPSPFGELSNSLVGSGDVSPIPHVGLSLCLSFAMHQF